MRSVLSATQTWLDSHQYLALWLEGIALLAIFIWDRIDASQQHKQTLAQIRASDAAANAANRSAEALINSERAWVIPELFSHAVKGADGVWYRRRDRVSLSTQDVLKGRHQDYFLKVTNMGRTPAQILALEIRYSCLPEGATDLPKTQPIPMGQGRTHEFIHLLGAEREIELPYLINIGEFMEHDYEDIKAGKTVAVFHGWVKYRHMFSAKDDCFADFCYSFTVNLERLSAVGRHTKQRQEEAN